MADTKVKSIRTNNNDAFYYAATARSAASALNTFLTEGKTWSSKTIYSLKVSGT